MKEERMKYWQSVITKWHASGLNKTEFCRQNNIDIPLFKYHSLKQHAYSKPRPKVSKGSGEGKVFAEVVCRSAISKPAAAAKKTEKVTKCPLILRLDCGGSIELTADFDAEILKRVLKIARDL